MADRGAGSREENTIPVKAGKLETQIAGKQAEKSPDLGFWIVLDNPDFSGTP